jgi:D-tyrosyl-tRNA(Tyr) deacylase
VRIVAQRVSSARVSVGGSVEGEIGPGLCLLIGVAPGDTEADVEKLADKIVNLRIFSDAGGPDDEGRMNLSLLDVGGSVLAVSQFTLYADCRRGRRPSFTGAASAELGNELYESFVRRVRDRGVDVRTGVFGALMKVEITNEGPVTIILDTAEL